MAIDAVDIRIANKINSLISDANLKFSKGYSAGVTRTMILESAWGVIVGYRQSQGANDTISVCSEHYLYARLIASKDLGHQIAIDAGRLAYDAYKIVKPPLKFVSDTIAKVIFPAEWLKYQEKDTESTFEWKHAVWENLGVNDGIRDRASPNTPVSLCLLSA